MLLKEGQNVRHLWTLIIFQWNEQFLITITRFYRQLPSLVALEQRQNIEDIFSTKNGRNCFICTYPKCRICLGKLSCPNVSGRIGFKKKYWLFDYTVICIRSLSALSFHKLPKQYCGWAYLEILRKSTTNTDERFGLNFKNLIIPLRSSPEIWEANI